MSDGEDATRVPASGPPGDARHGARSPVTVYRWTCPICGESRAGLADLAGEDPSEKAAFSLRQHVRTSAGEGHGPANRFPPGFDPTAVDGSVSVLSG